MFHQSRLVSFGGTPGKFIQPYEQPKIDTESDKTDEEDFEYLDSSKIDDQSFVLNISNLCNSKANQSTRESPKKKRSPQKHS